MNAIVAGPDRGIGDALETEGVTVSRLEGPVTGPQLESAGIGAAELLVLTDAGEATAAPVALELNPGLRVVVYTPESLPEFVSGTVDLAVDPETMATATVAEELAHNGPDI